MAPYGITKRNSLTPFKFLQSYYAREKVFIKERGVILLCYKDRKNIIFSLQFTEETCRFFQESARKRNRYCTKKLAVIRNYNQYMWLQPV